MKKTTFLLNLETKKFQQEAKRADDSLKGIGNTAVVEGKHIDAFSNSLKKGIAGALSVTAVVAFTRELTNVRKEMAKLEVAMETMLGSKAKADKLLASVQKFAVTTPFSLTEVSQATQTLLTFGTKAEDIEKTLEQLGNVASGVGKSLLDVIEPYGRIMITGQVGALELRSIALKGIPIYEELAKNIGVTTEEINKMTSESLITKQHVVDAFESMSSAGGKFAGLMDKQRKEIAGLQDELSGSIEELMLKYGKELEPAIKGVYKAGISLVDNFEDIAKVIVELIAVYGVYKATLVTITALQAGLGTTMFSFGLICTRVQKAIRALWASLSANPYALIAGAIASATYALYKYITYQTEAEKVESRRANVMKDVAKETFNVKKELDDYNKKLIEATKGSKEYNDIKSEIVSKYGQYLPNLDKEIDKVGNLSGVYDKLANSIGKSTEKRLMANFIEKEQDRLIDSATSKLPKLYTKVMKHYGKEEGSKIYADIIKSISTGEGREELRKKLARDFIWDWGRNAGEMFRGIYEEMDSVTSVLDTYKKEFDIASDVSKEGVKEINNELIKNYEYWEKIKTEAESALKSLGVDAQGGDDWNALNAKIKEATEQMNKYSVEIKKVSSDSEDSVSSDSEDSVSLLAEIEGQRLNIARIGVEDRLKLLELEKQQELNRLNESLKDKIYSEEEYNKLLLLIEERYNARRDLINKEESEKIRQALEDRLEEFKASEVQIQEIRNRYSKLRIEASGNELYDIKKINEAEAIEIASIQGDLTEKLKSLFGDVSKHSVGHLKSLKESFKSMLDGVADVRPSDMKALKEAFEQIENAIIIKDPFGALIPSINNYRATQEKLNKLKEEYNKLTPDKRVKVEEEIAKAINEQAEAQYRLNKSINATGTKGMEFVQAGNSFMGMLESLGVGGQSKSVDKMLGGLGDMFGALGSIDITKPMSIVTSAFGIIGGMGKYIYGLGRSITNIFGSSRKARRENERALEVLREQNIELERQYAIKQATAKIDRATTIFGTDEWSRSKALAEQFVLERKELEKAYKELEQIEVVTGSYVSKSFWRSKVKKEWSGLLDAYPELIKANGDFNISLAESILATKELDKKGREALENLTEQAKSAEDVFNSLKDSMSGLFGELGASITDSFIQAYKSGEDATNLFVGNVRQSMDKLAKSMISSIVFTDILEKYQDALVKMRLDSSLTEADIIRESSKLMGGLAKELAGAEDEMFALIGAYEQAMREQGLSSFEATQEVSAIVSQYQSLSEDTGNLLAGRANAILTNTTLIQGDINNIKSGVTTLAGNTLISAEKLTEMRDLALTSVGVLERIAMGTDNLEPIREDIRDMKNTLRDKL